MVPELAELTAGNMKKSTDLPSTVPGTCVVTVAPSQSACNVRLQRGGSAHSGSEPLMKSVDTTARGPPLTILESVAILPKASNAARISGEFQDSSPLAHESQTSVP